MESQEGCNHHRWSTFLSRTRRECGVHCLCHALVSAHVISFTESLVDCRLCERKAQACVNARLQQLSRRFGSQRLGVVPTFLHAMMSGSFHGALCPHRCHSNCALVTA